MREPPKRDDDRGAVAALGGAIIGFATGGPVGAVIGGLAGAAIFTEEDGVIADKQLPERFRTLITTEVETFNEGTTVQVVNEVPDTSGIPFQDRRHWLRIPDVICVSVDMQHSTRLSASSADRATAAAYQLFTGTAVRLFNSFDAAYIDVQGDGVFALFDQGQHYRALCAAVTFKTFTFEIAVKKIKESTGADVGTHCGIDQKTVLVRRVGLRRSPDRTDRQNEVWAGKPVNIASKLASLSQDNELLVSDRFFARLKVDHALKSCGCPDGMRQPLWNKKAVERRELFDFETYYSLTSNWCKHHGVEYCEALLAAR